MSGHSFRMNFVRDCQRAAWTSLAGGIDRSDRCLLSRYFTPEGGVMQDLAYIGLTILVFAVLFLIVRGVERFER